MNIQPLPKAIFNRAQELMIVDIHIELYGGGDDGSCDVSFMLQAEASEEQQLENQRDELSEEIADWALEAYGFTGDGDDHGIDINYDLVEMQVTYEWWNLRRMYDDPEKAPLISE